MGQGIIDFYNDLLIYYSFDCQVTFNFLELFRKIWAFGWCEAFEYCWAFIGMMGEVWKLRRKLRKKINLKNNQKFWNISEN